MFSCSLKANSSPEQQSPDLFDEYPLPTQEVSPVVNVSTKFRKQNKYFFIVQFKCIFSPVLEPAMFGRLYLPPTRECVFR